MKCISYVFFFFTFATFGQESVEATLMNSTETKVDQIIGIDNFDTFYFIEDNTIYKKTNDGKSLNFSNYQLGEITPVGFFTVI